MYGMSVTNIVFKMEFRFTELFIYSELPEMFMDCNSNYQYANDGDDLDSRSITVILVVAPCMLIVSSPLFVQLTHTYYYNIFKQLN